ncbi:MAG TPA: hypothetical protein VME46_02425 [Acidimicrobiales bacterium]|nr:hypothetical protein [Acidimicrobiales bacterium]
MPAREADLSRGGPNGLAIGPGSELYIATGTGAYRLGDDGRLYWVVGEDKSLPPGWGGVYSNPAIQNDFTNAYHLAFDSHDDLFVAGGGGFGLYERTATGRLRLVEVLRAQGGSPGSLASAPDGTVVAASGRWGLQRLGPAGSPLVVKAAWPRYHGTGHVPFCPASATAWPLRQKARSMSTPIKATPSPTRCSLRSCPPGVCSGFV